MASVKSIIHKEHYTTTIQSPSNEIVADEPMSNGGNDMGFSPTELLTASLAACTAITLRMYADKKNLPMTKAEITVNVEKSTTDNSTLITRYIFLGGELTDEMKQRLLEIANKCPVHNILSNPIQIKTELQ